MVKLRTLVMSLCLLIGSVGNISAQGFLDKVLKGLEKTNEVLDEADKLLGGDDNSNSNSNQRSDRSSRVAGFKIVSPHPDLDIQFKRCAASASTVVIDLVMTWYGDDAQIYLGGEGYKNNTTIAYDDNGKQYSYRQIPISVGGKDWDIYGFNSTLFPTDVPIKVRLEIQDVSESVQEFKRLQIYMRDVNDPITFYNVPITRRSEVSQIVAPVESDGEPTEMTELVGMELVSRHPLLDPLINIFGGYNSVYPTFMLYTQSSRNDCKVLGLRGKVKTLEEHFDRQKESYIYHFNEEGYLIAIDWAGQKFVFSSNGNTPADRKIYKETSGKKEELKKTDSEQYVYNEQGWLICNNTYPITYNYDQQGLCSQLQYTDSYPENIAKIIVDISRNKQGDIVLLNEKTTFYTESWDPDTQRIIPGKQDGEPTSSSKEIKYTYDDRNNWITCVSEFCNIKRNIVYY
ncbi:MAG: hypothetical protein SOR57_11955 [Parabacteroides sp.]|nr:hypothetical protein [Parabacteroides sp.]